MPSSKPTLVPPSKSAKPAARPTPQQSVAKPTPQASASTGVTPAAAGNSHSPSKVLVVVAAVFVGLILLGGIASYFVARSFVEKGVESLSGGKVKLTANGTKSTVKISDGSTTFSTDGKLPAGFPDDVPVYSPATLKLSFSGASHSYSATWSTLDQSDKVLTWYKSQLSRQGWTPKDDSQVVVGSVATVSYAKDSRELVLIVTGDSGAAQQTAINISVASKTAATGN